MLCILYGKTYKYRMLNIPTKILDQCGALLQQQKVSAKKIPFFLQWLRYHLDFCHKYSHTAFAPSSLSLLIRIELHMIRSQPSLLLF